MRYPAYLEKKFNFPGFYRVKLALPSMGLPDPASDLGSQLAKALEPSNIKSGQTVAVGVGSRGMNEIAHLVAQICRSIKDKGAHPVIIPAMGSHGSATPEGQEKTLAKLGVTSDFCGAPIVCQMDAVEVGRVFDDVPVYFSKNAMEADHSICINRIKPHTKFKGDVESGLYKMLVVGMGKHTGALTYHNFALKYGFHKLLKAMGDTIIEQTNLCLGIGVVEDAYDRVMKIEVIPAAQISAREPDLLILAKAHFPSLPYKQLDLLVVRQIGKEISGSGMDPNVTGKTFDFMEDDFSQSLYAKRLVVLDLSANTAGNAIGLGNADIITEKVFEGMDYQSTLMNALTSMSLRKAAIPVRLPSEEKAVQAGFQTIGPMPPEKVRAVIIRDTMHTTDFLASEALGPETQKLSCLKEMTPFRLSFTSCGDLIAPGP
ncbi:lactate racemase domain-containing protein [uncultured Desulfobacter sp.]|uniref:lactate racemase domain-containing protein n=1 Tax=uncultured Desulfobacter sp. TaxID=240139 RepID=UPI002AABF8AD|nr:lactate racemase domain-containing protein [uncultured Desulfobacter sp.]